MTGFDRRSPGSMPGLRGPASPDRATLAIAALLGGAMVAVGAFVPTSWWVGVFAHPLRVERLGAVPRTTSDGAVAWRVALGVGGVLIPAIVALIALFCRRCGGVSTPESSQPSRQLGGRGSRRLGMPALLGLMILGIIFRAPRLLESLWYDEIAAFLDFSQFGPGPTMGNYFTQSNHVFQGILAWVSVAVSGGADELSLRVPTLIASLLTIPAMLAMGREAVIGAQPSGVPDRVRRDLPQVLAWIAALSPIAVLEAVEARGYAFMILAAAVATTLFLRGLRRPTATTWSLYAVVVALGAWSHLVTTCVALGHGAIVAWVLAAGFVRARGTSLETESGSVDVTGAVRAGPRACARGSDGCVVDRGAALAAAAALVLSAVVTVVLYAPALPDMLAIRSEFRALDGNEPTLIGPEGVHALMTFGGAWFWWSALPAAACAVVGLGACARDAGLRRAALAALAGVPIAVALAWFGDSWLYARFLLFALPGAGLLMGAGIATIAARSWVAGIAAVVVIGVAWIGDLAVRAPKQPLRDAVLEVAAARGPRPTQRDKVATIGLADNVLAWYGVLRGIDIVSTGPLGRDLEAILDRDDPRFVILLYPRSVAAERFDLIERRGYVLRSRHAGWVDWTNGDVMVFERGTGRSRATVDSGTLLSTNPDS